MRKFKIDNTSDVPVGAIGTVMQVSSAPYVKMDSDDYNDTSYAGQIATILSEDELELIKSVNPTTDYLTAQFIEHAVIEYGSTEENIQIIKDYGRQCAMRALKDAAENADTINKGNSFGDSWCVDKDSILDTEIITP